MRVMVKYLYLFRRRWKCPPVTNTLAFYAGASLNQPKKVYNIDHKDHCYKTFYSCKLVPVKPFQPSLFFFPVRPKPTRVKYLSGAPLEGRFLSLPSNIRLGTKGLPGPNTPAYHKELQITVIKVLYDWAQISKRMVQDHMPDNVLDAFDKVGLY